MKQKDINWAVDQSDRIEPDLFPGRMSDEEIAMHHAAKIEAQESVKALLDSKGLNKPHPRVVEIKKQLQANKDADLYARAETIMTQIYPGAYNVKCWSTGSIDGTLDMLVAADAAIKNGAARLVTNIDGDTGEH